MPYKKLSELPDRVKNHLPHHAQEIFMQAFNHAWKEYQDECKRRDEESLEEVSFKVAWAAVKHKYHKDEDGQWVKNDQY